MLRQLSAVVSSKYYVQFCLQINSMSRSSSCDSSWKMPAENVDQLGDKGTLILNETENKGGCRMYRGERRGSQILVMVGLVG